METDYNNPGPTCQKIEDLIRWVRPIVRRWPRAERETLGADVMNQLHTMYRLATKARLHYYNKSTLRDLDVEKEMLKGFMREASRTSYTDKRGNVRYLIEVHSYGVWCGMIEEIGNLIGGWIKKAEAKTSGKKESRDE
ncbi:MAG: hypothetical protein IJ153_05655 [Clostridia bacterium]|nr:hypothetical protein [Clostridia bacterium]MBQ9211170.1 hypothetical protein [Clostridia bacterium]